MNLAEHRLGPALWLRRAGLWAAWSGRALWREATPRLVLSLSALLAAAASLTFYPGLMSRDSLSAWRQALTGLHSDLHPPLLALMMRSVVLAQGELAGYIFTQALAFYLSAIGLGTMLARGDGRRQLMASLLVSTYPPGWVYAVTAWKDVLEAVALCGWPSLMSLRFSPRARHDLAGVAGSLALAVRHNAPTLLPVVGCLSAGCVHWLAPGSARPSLLVLAWGRPALSTWRASRKERGLTMGLAASCSTTSTTSFTHGGRSFLPPICSGPGSTRNQGLDPGPGADLRRAAVFVAR
jgi:hypothetical protein